MSIYKIGITGSIGSGKSTVTRLISESGIRVIDADKISRNITSSDEIVLHELAKAFGEDIINSDGSLERRKLASIAFSNEKNKAQLTTIVTDRVKDIMWEMVAELETVEKLVVMDIPLLFESGLIECFDEVWVVVADKDIRYQRAHKRDGISKEDFDARDNAQTSEVDKIAFADLIIHNDKDHQALETKVKIEIRRIKQISGIDR